GVNYIVGADILPEARTAALRDRPQVYQYYEVADFCHLTDTQEEKLQRENFNVLTTVAALGFDDVPLDAFRTAYELLEPEGIIGFNIRDKFLDRQADDSGFHAYITQKLDTEVEILFEETYVHRLNVAGQPIE